jgi:acetyltransferase-like isoleucine patch superfamily enzyme
MRKLISFLSRVSFYLRKTLFSFYNLFLFKSIGSGTVLFKPYRVDGYENIIIGSNTIVQKNSWLYCKSVDDNNPVLQIGNNCTLGYNNHITSVKSVIIGDYVLTANNVYISDNLHEYQDIKVPIILQSVYFKSPVQIGYGSWIGENVSIIGASIGKNCVIGANSVVTKDVPDYSVAAGSPAKVIKTYNFALKYWVRL